MDTIYDLCKIRESVILMAWDKEVQRRLESGMSI